MPRRLLIASRLPRVPRVFSPRFDRPLAGPSRPALASRRGRSPTSYPVYPVLWASQRLAPEEPEVYSRLGDALVGMGDRDRASAQYRRALALAPEDSETAAKLAAIETQ